MLAAVLLMLLGSSGVEASGEAEEMTPERLVVRTFGFSKAVEEDILFVAEETMTDPAILAAMVRRESDGLYTAVGYCTKWKKIKRGEKAKCLDHASCRTGCRGNRKIWKNHLAIGLWQMWDTSTSSWVRWYSEKVKPITADCAMERFCARRMMVAVVKYLQSVKPRECDEDSPCMWDSAWISRWNGCAFCEAVVLESWDAWDKVRALAPDMFHPDLLRDVRSE